MSMMLRCAAALIIAAAFSLLAAPAQAACQLSSGETLSFAASGSYAVRSGSVADISGSAGFRCGGALIVLLSSNQARASVTSAGGFHLTGPGGERIPYRLSADPAGTYRLDQGGAVDYFDPALLSLLGILNGGSFNPKFYARLTAGANVAAGRYSDTMTVNWDWRVCHGISLLGICVLGESGTGTATLRVTMDVASDCRISAPPLAFGTASLASQFAAVSQSVLVDCTKGTQFSVSFTDGASGAARPWRTMTGAAGRTLKYNLYRPDGSTIWDQSNPLPAPEAGTGAEAPGQAIPYTARIDPAQPTPPAGQYSDTVSVVLTF